MSESERESKREEILSKLSTTHSGVSDSKLREKTREFEEEAYSSATSRADYDSRIDDSMSNLSNQPSRCPFMR